LKKHSNYRKARIRAIKLLRNIDLVVAKDESEKLLEYDLKNSDKKEIAASRKIRDVIKLNIGSLTRFILLEHLESPGRCSG
jgi:hypothetical protein